MGSTSIKSELLRIGTAIALHEPTAAWYLRSSVHLSWQNSTQFLPGLAIEACFQQTNPRRQLEIIHHVSMKTIEPCGNTEIIIQANADPEEYEEPLAEYVLQAFRQYECRPHPLIPAGLGGLVTEASVVSARELLVDNHG